MWGVTVDTGCCWVGACALGVVLCKREIYNWCVYSVWTRILHIRLAFFTVNVISIDPLQLSGTSIASNQLLTGNHWTVIATEFDAKLSYYGDSLGYPIPSNLIVETQQVFTELRILLGEQIATSYTVIALYIHKTAFDTKGKHACSRECHNYPVQTCSPSCGVIPVILVAVASFCPKEVWQYMLLPQLQCHPVTSLLRIYHQPSTYAQYLRVVLTTRLLTETIKFKMLLISQHFIPTNLSYCKCW